MNWHRTGDASAAPLPRLGEAPYDAQRVVHRKDVPVVGITTLPCSPGDVVLVDARQTDPVEVWYVAVLGEEQPPATDVLVTGTGHPVPPGALHLGSVLSPHNPRTGVQRGDLVWHVWALPTVQPAPATTSTEEKF